MDTLSRDEIGLLVEQPAAICLSLFMPTRRAGPETQQNAIRLENVLRQAEQRLAARGVQESAARALLAPARRLLDDWEFWQHQRDGLAIFAGPRLFRAYRVPLALAEQCIVDTCFHVIPLLPLLDDDGLFFVLSLSLSGARLLRCTRDEARLVALHGVPAGLEDSLKYDEFGKQPQLHPGLPGRGGERGAIFHGQGARVDTIKEEIQRYFQQVDHGVSAELRGQRAPLLLAGVEHLLAIYRRVNSYPHLIEGGLLGSPDELRPEDLGARGWALVYPLFQRSRAVALARYRALADARPALASSYLRLIVPAAYEGRVDTLLVGQGRALPGAFEPSSGVLLLHDPDQRDNGDLLEVAVAGTLAHQGEVYPIAPELMPDGAPVAAILRY